MPDLDDLELTRTESSACEKAEIIMKRIYPHQAYPKRDSQQVLRHGFGRRIEQTPQSITVAELVLREDLAATAAILRGRVFELKAKNPDISDARIGVLYALADMLGPTMTRDWGPLWLALGRNDWAEVLRELLDCHLVRMAAESQEHKKQITELIVMLYEGSVH